MINFHKNIHVIFFKIRKSEEKSNFQLFEISRFFFLVLIHMWKNWMIFMFDNIITIKIVKVWEIWNRAAKKKLFKPTNCFLKILILIKSVKMKLRIITKKYAINLGIPSPTKSILWPMFLTETTRRRRMVNWQFRKLIFF